MQSDRTIPRALASLAVLALHVMLLWLLVDSSTTRSAREQNAAPPTRITLRLITASPPTAPAPVAIEAPGRVPKPSRPAEPSSRTRKATPEPGTSAMTVPLREAAIRPEPAASAESLAPSLLDTEATRRAIRASARTASLGDQLAQAREEPERPGAQARLANGVKAAGKGDCLKGEFAGAGMGLLSLPFLAIATAQGDCAK